MAEQLREQRERRHHQGLGTAQRVAVDAVEGVELADSDDTGVEGGDLAGEAAAREGERRTAARGGGLRTAMREGGQRTAT